MLGPRGPFSAYNQSWLSTWLIQPYECVGIPVRISVCKVNICPPFACDTGTVTEFMKDVILSLIFRVDGGWDQIGDKFLFRAYQCSVGLANTRNWTT